MGKGGAAVWDEEKHCKCEMGYLFKCCFLVYVALCLLQQRGTQSSSDEVKKSRHF